jgi:copper homeostasis protein
MRRILLEVCVDDADGLSAAVEGGADRVELCAALEVGGLTPSPGLMRLAASAGVPVQVMIRPRPGAFVWSPADLDAMRRDVDAVGEAGLAGVVIGANRPDGALDAEALADLVARAGTLSVTVHRCFDLVPDVAAAAATLVALGADRVLTSGGAVRAVDGLERLRATAAAMAGRVAVMPGAGITAETVGALLAEPWCTEVHASCSARGSEPPPAVVALGFAAGPRRVTDRRAVAALRARLGGAGGTAS